MGLNRDYLNFIESSIQSVFGDRVYDLNMLELGDQIIDDSGWQFNYMTGKDYFTSLGFKHTSVDWNGLNGALIRDLRDQNQFQEWNGHFDILTNSGTTEHVEPLDSQYNCWKILHDCLKIGGVSIHLIPDVNERDMRGHWVGHCSLYYSDQFFQILARECNYKILFNNVIRGLRCVSFVKTKDSQFKISKEMILQNIAVR
jgi:hypothetical protein